jgi:hypothetical protein
MSTSAAPLLQPQNNPDSQGRPSGQAPAPEVQTRTSLAVTPVPADSTATTLDHGDRFPSQATAQHPQLQRQLDSAHHHHHNRLHNHVDGSTLASASAPGPTQNQSQSQSQNQNQLEAANIAHFDALGHDFDKQNPFSAEFADRLSRALRRLSLSHRSAASSSSSSNDDVGSLVLDEDATSVLDYACGSGTCHTPPFRVGMVF